MKKNISVWEGIPMLKKLFSLFLCLMLIVPTVVFADEGDMPVLEKPAGLVVRHNESNDLILRLTHPDSIMEYMNNNEYVIHYELDFKINDGPWKFDNNWDGVFLREGLIGYYENTYGKMLVAHLLNNYNHDGGNSVDIMVFPWNLDLDVDAFDLKNNSYSFRFRYAYEYSVQDPATGEWGYRVITSPYSEVATIGKGQEASLPDSLEAPSNLRGVLKNRDDGRPYFFLTLDIPKSIEDAYKVTSIWTKFDWKTGNGKWATESGELPFEESYMMLSGSVEIDPIDEGRWGEIDIKENTYYFRAYFEMQKPDGSILRSPFSNVVEIGTPKFYSNANDWAQPELQKAYDEGLIPDILLGADMTKPVTREEFCEIAVLLYEKSTGESVRPVSPNPFTDTSNPQILKAYKLGITKGTSENTFSPNKSITRQECATMLYRAIRAIVPDADYSVAGVPDFPDQKDIDSWAVEATKYMFKLGIIKGNDKGYFMPKATTSAEEAAGYGTATREAAILMSVRTSEKLPDLPKDPGGTDGGTQGASTSGTPTLDSLMSKALSIDTGYFESVSDVGGYTIESKYWKKGDKVKKAETGYDGKTKIDIFDMSEGVAYSYFEGDAQAIRTIYEVSDLNAYINPFHIIGPFGQESGDEAAEIKIIGSETVDGISCSVVAVIVEGETLARIWVSEDGLKRQSEIPYFGMPRTTRYLNYKLGGPISDSEFELPPGMTVDENFSVTITE